ncbi:DUF4231 domain-containing protein [Argonema antarcticum]|uniref:DUF4231 domain-containing protein n=1 Tax=Argonema antarcticum TaxID=2942763 RepID=UPI002013B7D5|nr:DUF4231 domain-containing protein [Argonema antarcticum]MCL1474097.1 DUF4231 domain-containing protein [Argonema antarcticum A004/B2]
MTNSDRANQDEISSPVEQLSSTSSPNMSLILKSVEYFFLAAFVCAGIINFFLPGNPVEVIWLAALVSLWLFVFLTNRQLSSNVRFGENQLDIAKKAELYSYLSGNNNLSESNQINPAREKALQYCKELIEDYKATRSNSRNFYYSLQLATVVFSGITPILVLVDKLDIGISWFKWLPVIFPAIASIVASVVTSFPFQENWIAANKSVESLEAEQEKFILGVTQPYRCYDVDDETERQKKAKQAIENFIVEVNNIHLKQVEDSGKTKSKEDKSESGQSAESK